jgi:hypothetical protein
VARHDANAVRLANELGPVGVGAGFENNLTASRASLQQSLYACPRVGLEQAEGNRPQERRLADAVLSDNQRPGPFQNDVENVERADVLQAHPAQVWHVLDAIDHWITPSTLMPRRRRRGANAGIIPGAVSPAGQA